MPESLPSLAPARVHHWAELLKVLLEPIGDIDKKLFHSRVAPVAYIKSASALDILAKNHNNRRDVLTVAYLAANLYAIVKVGVFELALPRKHLLLYGVAFILWGSLILLGCNAVLMNGPPDSHT